MTSTEILNRKVLKKVTRRLIPLLFALYIIAYLDRMKDTTGSFTGGLLFLSAALLIGAILTLVVRYNSLLEPVDRR